MTKQDLTRQIMAEIRQGKLKRREGGFMPTSDMLYMTKRLYALHDEIEIIEQEERNQLDAKKLTLSKRIKALWSAK